MPAKSPAVVIGLGLNALGTVRALDAAGIPSYVITPGAGGPCERTRHGEKILCSTMNTDPEALIKCLVQLRERFDRPAVLFPSGDLYLELVSNARASLVDGYLLPFPEKRLVDLIIDKNRSIASPRTTRSAFHRPSSPTTSAMSRRGRRICTTHTWSNPR